MFVCHPNYFDVQGAENIGKEIRRLEKVIARDPENPGKAPAYLQLALLYTHYDNPIPNYLRSLKMFEKYHELDPNGQIHDEVVYLEALVQTVVEADDKRMRIANRAAKLGRNNKKLIDANTKMVGEKQELQDAMEKLKLLELMMEEKRRHLK